MKSPTQAWNWIKGRVKPEWKTAFFATFAMGLLTHLPILLSDIPNHDGLDSIYFDQNMVTSGRWFLSAACGLSSYYTLPWVIGVLGVLYLSLACVALVEFLEVRHKGCIVLIGGLLATFPSIASTFAYVYTLDGYMLALLLAVLAVLLTARFRWGFLAGMACLGFSMGIYQAYLPFAVLLSLYGILMLALSGLPFREKVRRGARYLYMGVLGMAFYYLALQVLLRLQGKVLDDYQGINGMGALGGRGLAGILKQIYQDFFAFTLKGNVFFQNVYSACALCALSLLLIWGVARLALRKKWWKSPWFYGILFVSGFGLPLATNLILLVSPDVTYHLLMRYQWVLLIICPVAFLDRYGCEKPLESWVLLLAAGILTFHYAVTDNIAYSNLEKRYEKTYAYCVRLLDRIEQTPGYYQGIPIAMVGVVGDESFPETDITGEVTSGMIGIPGDSLLYRGDNYELFIRHYLGATLNILPADAMAEAYYADFYREMESFPGADSIRIVDGILYIKTENIE